MRNKKEIAACLVKSTVKKGRETVNTSEVLRGLKFDVFTKEKHSLITAHEQENIEMNSKIIDTWDL